MPSSMSLALRPGLPLGLISTCIVTALRSSRTVPTGTTVRVLEVFPADSGGGFRQRDRPDPVRRDRCGRARPKRRQILCFRRILASISMLATISGVPAAQ
jgi:hypothetical protein